MSWERLAGGWGGVELTACPWHAAVNVRRTQVHPVPRQHVHNVVRLVGLMEYRIKYGEHCIALLLTLCGAIRKRRGEHMQHLTALCAGNRPAPELTTPDTLTAL